MTQGSQPLSPEELDRWWKETGEHELRQVLYWKWDPIRVNDAFPNTADEYDRYAPEVVSALRDGASEADLVDLLSTIEREQMGLKLTRAEQLQKLAVELAVWFGQSQRLWVGFGPVRR